MAHRLLGRGFQNVQKKVAETRERFNNLLILDFEATCDSEKVLEPQEIIEFPCLAVSTDNWQVKDVFHHYVMPRVNPILTPFCTDLTGIMQETVDDQPRFPEVFANFQQWLADGGYLENDSSSAFLTCGDWDLKVMLPKQCALENLEVPKYFGSWIDLKKSYCEATSHYPRSLKDMLLRLDLPLQGRLHSGLCDTQNMARIVTELKQRHNAIFNVNSPQRLKINHSTT